jgi:hypothetical protein
MFCKNLKRVCREPLGEITLEKKLWEQGKRAELYVFRSLGGVALVPEFCERTSYLYPYVFGL